MADKQQLHQLVDQLPESEMPAAVRYLRLLNGFAGDEAPVSARMQTRITAARANPNAGISSREFVREVLEDLAAATPHDEPPLLCEADRSELKRFEGRLMDRLEQFELTLVREFLRLCDAEVLREDDS